MKPTHAIWAMVILLVCLHQDVWFWSDTTLVFGFLPITLLYHMGISTAAGVTWYLATKFAWPHELEHTDAAPQGGAPE